MLLIVQHAGKSEEVQVEGEAAYVLAQDLSAAIQKTLDVPVHKQKLIFKGKVLENGKPLDSYGVKERSKIMLLASGAVTKVSPGSPECLLQLSSPHETSRHAAPKKQGPQNISACAIINHLQIQMHQLQARLQSPAQVQGCWNALTVAGSTGGPASGRRAQKSGLGPKGGSPERCGSRFNWPEATAQPFCCKPADAQA